MDERYREAKKLFLTACDLGPTERAQWLDRECGQDTDLRAQVDSLLAQYDGPTATLDPVGTQVAPSRADGDLTRIGSYRLIREIGRGGMGVVYLGVSEAGHFKHRAAIKVLKRGMDTDEVLHRFELERQLLAALNHAGIARLYDGGVTDEGLPYFAMEYVEGQAIDEYCDTHRLHIGERLQLFRQVCSAVHYAHQNLVVHRDLKPSNIIVDRDGVPKLLDFGIAKLINPEMALFTGDPTAPELRIMTPEYASPEQVRGDPITTASDIYSLGVLLYELVSGHRPYRLHSRVKEEILRVICEVEPERPSTAVTKVEEIEAGEGEPATASTSITPELVSRVREGRPDRLRRRLTGDIDNIVLMAMRKEPQRRYQSAEQFAADLQRHLDGLPVIARRDTPGYRIAKFIRRNRGGVAAAAVIVLVLVAGIVGTSWWANIAVKERERAEQMSLEAETARATAVAERERAEQASLEAEAARDYAKRLLDDLLVLQVAMADFQDEVAPQDGSLEARNVLAESALESLEDLRYVLNDDLKQALASAYDKVGAIRGGVRNPSQGDISTALENYRHGLVLRQDLVAAQPDDLELRKQLSNSHMHVADMHKRSGDTSSALAEYDKALCIVEEMAEVDPRYRRDLARALGNVGAALYGLGRYGDTLEHYDRSLTLRRQLVAENPDVASFERDLSVGIIRMASMKAEVGDDPAALDLLMEAIDVRDRLAASDPESGRYRRDLGIAHYYAAEFLVSRGRLDEAEVHIERFLLTARQRAEDNPSDARSKLDLAVAYEIAGMARARSGDPEAAIADLESFTRIITALAEADPDDAQYRWRVADSHRRIAEAQYLLGNDLTAAREYDRALEILSAMTTENPDDISRRKVEAETLSALGEVLLVMESAQEAETTLAVALAIYEPLHERQPRSVDVRWGLVETLQRLATLFEERGDTNQARAHADEALELLGDAPPGPRTDALRQRLEETRKGTNG